MSFEGIEGALDKWVIVRFMHLPYELKSAVTGLKNVEGKWIRYKLRGVDHIGIWIENPWFEIVPSSSAEDIPEEQKQALKGEALVLIKWEHIATIVYIGGQQVEDVPMGFPAPPQ